MGGAAWYDLTNNMPPGHVYGVKSRYEKFNASSNKWYIDYWLGESPYTNLHEILYEVYENTRNRLFYIVIFF